MALVAITLGLGLGSEGTGLGEMNGARAALFGLLWAGMFYLSYMTGSLAMAFSVAYLCRYGFRRRPIRNWVLSGAVGLLLALPQIAVFVRVHFPARASQEGSPLRAAARLFHGVFISEAMLPWSPLAVAFAATVTLPLVLLYSATALKGVRHGGSSPWLANDRNRVGFSALVLFVLVLALGVASGLGVKARSFLVAAPLLALLAAQGFALLRRRWLRFWMVAFSLLWVVFGCSNLLLRRGTAKGGLNDHPEEVAEFVKQNAGGDCCLVFVHDPALVYILNRHQLPLTSTVSLFPDYVHGVPAGVIQRRCQPREVFVVKSFAGWTDEGIRSKVDFAEGRALAGLAQALRVQDIGVDRHRLVCARFHELQNALSRVQIAVQHRNISSTSHQRARNFAAQGSCPAGDHHCLPAEIIKAG